MYLWMWFLLNTEEESRLKNQDCDKIKSVRLTYSGGA